MSAAHNEGGEPLDPWVEPPDVQAILRKPMDTVNDRDVFRVRDWLLESPRIEQLLQLMSAGIGRYGIYVSDDVADNALATFFDKPLSNTIRNYTWSTGPYKHYLFKSISRAASAQGKKLVRDEQRQAPEEDLEREKPRSLRSTEDEVISRQFTEAVNNCIEQLRDKLRAIFKLFFYGQLTDSEIADSLGFSVNDVKVSKHRARKSLRPCLEAAAAI